MQLRSRSPGTIQIRLCLQFATIQITLCLQFATIQITLCLLFATIQITLCLQFATILGVFAKLRKATIMFVVSVL